MKTAALIAVAVLALGSMLWAADDAVVAPQPAANRQSLIANRQSADAVALPQIMTYQGRLTDATGTPVPDGEYSITFKLYAQLTGGSPFWMETQKVGTRDGLFSVLLGSVTPITTGDGRPGTAAYLGMTVAGSEEMVPRLRIAGTGLSGQGDASRVPPGGTDDDDEWVRSSPADSVLYTIRRLGIARGGCANVLYGNWKCSMTNLGSSCTTGISGTPGLPLGNMAVLGGYGNRVWAPYTSVGGGRNNKAGNDAADTSAIVVGGYGNKANAKFSYIAGGQNNTADGVSASIGGGSSNSASGTSASIGGGDLNTASGSEATVAGGTSNTASGANTTVGGGYNNATSGGSSTVAGGYDNIASGDFTAVGGGIYNSANSGYGTVAGGYSNTASYASVVAGGAYNRASGYDAAIVGGAYNTASANYGAIGGGLYDTTGATYCGAFCGYANVAGRHSVDSCAAVCGGKANVADSIFTYIGGGYHNIASGYGSTIGGGYTNTATNHYATVGGGYLNIASGYTSTVGGGNTNAATGLSATVGGGQYDTASGTCATVGGGYYNVASGDYSMAVGQSNTASAAYAMAVGTGNQASGSYSQMGGDWNTATAEDATVAGGYSNHATALAATVAGGRYCDAAADYGFAVGNNSDVSSGHTNSAAFNGQTTTASGQTRVGALSKASGTFTIDHPLDPLNRILNHYFVESPDMSNIYSGSVVLDAGGRAEVRLPEYFNALNRSPRVQLTGVGTSDVYVAEKVNGNRFVVGGKPGAEVYWLVLGDRKDPSAEITRVIMPVEQPKTGALAGHSLDDDFLRSTKDQLDRMGAGGKFDFRTAEGRQKYEETKHPPKKPAVVK